MASFKVLHVPVTSLEDATRNAEQLNQLFAAPGALTPFPQLVSSQKLTLVAAGTVDGRVATLGVSGYGLTGVVRTAVGTYTVSHGKTAGNFGYGTVTCQGVTTAGSTGQLQPNNTTSSFVRTYNAAALVDEVFDVIIFG